MELYWLCFVIFCLHMYCNYKFTGPTQCSILLCSSGGLPPKINPCREISRIKTSTCIYILENVLPFRPFQSRFFSHSSSGGWCQAHLFPSLHSCRDLVLVWVRLGLQWRTRLVKWAIKAAFLGVGLREIQPTSPKKMRKIVGKLISPDRVFRSCLLFSYC